MEPGAARPEPGGSVVGADDAAFVAALRRGDELAFAALLERYHNALVRLALAYVADRAVAEEVAQETWLGVLTGLDRFEGRASLKTWIFRILINRARTRGERERRSIPFSALAPEDPGPDEPAVDPARFLPPEHAHWPGHWAEPPRSWGATPEAWLLRDEVRDHLRQAIDELPPGQRTVIMLRDVEGFAADEVCNILGISETNQRVLLHRARSRVRRALEQYFSEE